MIMIIFHIIIIITEGNKSLTFKLDKISDLKDESRVEVNETFYAFISQMNFNYSIHYKNDECELINFNSSDKFYIRII